MMHSMRELYVPAHGNGRDRLAGVDARVKTVVAMALVVGVVVSAKVIFPTAVLGICIILACGVRAPVKSMLRRLAGPMGFALVVCALRALMTGGHPLLRLHVGGWEWIISREGLAQGMMIGLRVLASTSVLLVLCAATPVHKIVAVLRWAKMPRSWVEIAMLMYRYIFVLFEQAASVLAAQKVRMGYGRFARSLSSMGDLAGVVTLRAMDQAEKTHGAMVARGYHGSLQVAPLPKMRKRDAAQMLAGMLLAVGMYLLAEGGNAWIH